MISKETVRNLILDIKKATGLTQSQIAKAIGMKPDSLSQQLSREESLELIYKRLLSGFKENLVERDYQSMVIEEPLPAYQKIKATDMAALEYIDLYAMSRVILGILAEMESKQSGELVQAVLNKYQRAVEAEREAKRKELSELLGSS